MTGKYSKVKVLERAITWGVPRSKKKKENVGASFPELLIPKYWVNNSRSEIHIEVDTATCAHELIIFSFRKPFHPKCAAYSCKELRNKRRSMCFSFTIHRIQKSLSMQLHNHKTTKSVESYITMVSLVSLPEVDVITFGIMWKEDQNNNVQSLFVQPIMCKVLN